MAEICFINGIGNAHPSRDACIEDGGIPVPEEFSGNRLPNEALLTASSPPQVEVVRQWQPLINECVQALQNGGQDGAQYLRARAELETLSLQLFEDAFINDRPDAAARSSWQSLINLFEQYPLDSGVLTCLVRLGRPQVLAEDRLLLFQFISEGENLSPRTISGIQRRLLSCLRESALEYNGWQSDEYLSFSSAFIVAFEGLTGPEGFEYFVRESLLHNLEEVLIGRLLIDEEERIALRFCSEEYFIYRLDRAMREWISLPIGSDQKVAAFRHFHDLSMIALARGMSMEAYQFGRFLVDANPGLNEEDYLELYRLSQVYHTRENADNNLERERFADLFESLAERFFNAEINSEDRQAFSAGLNILYDMGPRFGFTPAALDTLLEVLAESANVNLEINNGVENLDTVYSSDRVTVGPEGLPPEVIKVLEQAGGYSLVAGNLREIIFTPEIDEGYDLEVGEHGGNALSGMRQVQIDVIDPEGNPLPAWEIAYILMHEAAHVAWMRSVSEEFLQSTPNERHAYLVGARFLETYLQQGIYNGQIDPHSEEAFAMARMIVSDRLAARGANLVLGYDLDNYDPYHIQLPSAQFLQAHGLNTVRDLDLNTYPTNLSMYFALERFADQDCSTLEQLQYLTSVMIEEDAQEYLAGLNG